MPNAPGRGGQDDRDDLVRFRDALPLDLFNPERLLARALPVPD